MENKKKNNIVLKIIAVFFIIYIALFIANLSGYYESKIRDSTIATEESIKEFEIKVQNGEEVDITSYLKSEREDYSSKMSNLGDNLTNNIELFVFKSAGIFTNIFKSLF